MTPSATIYILCPHSNKAAGGVKTLYRHVDILKRHGFSAIILHNKRHYRQRWFANSTPVQFIGNVQPRPNDVLVIPELYHDPFQPAELTFGKQLIAVINPKERSITRLRNLIAKMARIVILNLGSYNTFKSYQHESLPSVIPYLHDKVIGVVTISEDSQRYLKHAFPKLDVARITKSVNTSVFNYDNAKNKKLLRICYMPNRRKNIRDTVQILSILRIHKALGQFELVPIANKSESDVAAIMRSSLMYLSFSHQEGLPRPPMEAMLCHCLVVGYHGRGGREYFNPDFCYPIEEGNIISFTQTLETLLAALQQNASAFTEKTKMAAQYIETHYSMKQEEQDIVDYWNTVVKR